MTYTHTQHVYVYSIYVQRYITNDIHTHAAWKPCVLVCSGLF